MSQPAGPGRAESAAPGAAARLVAPGPPAAPPGGPLYGARYGDPAYEARYGPSLTTSATVPADATPTLPATGARVASGGVGAGGNGGVGAGGLTYRPGVVTLRPQSVGDLLDGAVRTLRVRPGLFLGAGAVAMILGTVVRAAVDALIGVSLVAPDGSATLRITPSFALLPAVGALLAGVLAVPAAEAVLGGGLEPGRIRALLRPRWGALLAYVAFAAAAGLVPTLLIWYALGGRAAQQLDLLLAMLGLALVAGLVRLPFIAAPAAIVLEGAGPWRAIRRSMTLVRGYLGRTLGLSLLAGLLVTLVSVALVTPLAVAVTVASATTGYALADGPLGPALTTLFGILSGCLTMPFEATLRSLYYVDLRVRAEGLDVLLVDAVAPRGGRR